MNNKSERSRQTLPETGWDEQTVLEMLERRKTADADWRHGRSWSLVYYGGDEHDAFLKRAYDVFFSENGVSPTAFPSLARMEAEVVSMGLGLMQAGADGVGTMASGGTESILLAMKSYRDKAHAQGRTDETLEILLPESAHPAFLKAANYFGLRAVPIRLGSDFRADPEDASAKVTSRTICIAASAPCYPYGVVDPIGALSEVALQHGIGLHVDACLGGFILPFMRQLGYSVPDFDFRVPGVTSISSDLHKNGYTAKGASLALYRTAELRSYQFFLTADWTGGLYGSPTMTGTRPGGAVAAAWAAMMRIGVDGYTDLTRRALGVAKRLTDGIKEIPGLFILGEPDMTVFAFGSDTHNIFSIARRLQAAGWRMDRQQRPDCLHMIATLNHEQSVEPFLRDLHRAVADEQASPQPLEDDKYQMLYGVTSDIPAHMDPLDYMRQQMGEVYDL